ncbi:5-(carboxyamino)imidazole ribonucleotide synthase [Brucella anthropi]|uniref:5-(carboxyamino)imidazole ribonucleotide synthase n=1 Tax=Brucella anthropi TaxID=529 RepID=UPI00235EEE7C|nr:5-(carboxyamino)imidazole ribonucleotide synthase [Brucella anthropi]
MENSELNSALGPGATIGIIGGGQLGRMLAMAAARLGFETVILEPQADCPAAQVANRQIVAAYDDPSALAELAAASDVITYEFENVPVSAADRLAETALVLPPPAALEVSQDRFTEKQFLNSSDIETAPWRLVDDEETLIAALGALGERGILKTRRLGYDGKGQVRLTSLDESEAHKAILAINRAPAILEGFVEFEREVSVIVARDRSGNVAIFDIAENMHKDGILATSTVPAAISENTADAARSAATKLLHALDYVGVLGLEFFVLKDGRLLANEFAPRVHNSGHWTEAACAISQFEQHIRAVAGLPLGNTDRHSDCVMENLIGGDIDKVPAILSEKNAVLHLYGKKEARPGRKMGHVTRIHPRGE